MKNDSTNAILLTEAVRKGDLELVKKLVEQNHIDPNGNQEFLIFPVETAAHEGKLEIMTYLIEKGANVNVVSEDGWTPIMSALSNQHDGIALLLLKHGARITGSNAAGFSNLHYAAKNGNLEVIKALLDKKADINYLSVDYDEDNPAKTPLNMATSSEVIAFLKEKGAKKAKDLQK